jgi:small redox-active disulfide protein 2
MKIKILGPGCAKCQTMQKFTLEALEALGITADVEKVEDIQEMLKYNILSTPALLIDEEIKIKGRPGSVKEIKEILKR